MALNLEFVETFPPVPSLTRAKSYVLGGSPDGKTYLYTSQKGVIIRDVENPKKCDVYCEHVKNATTAQYSPSGAYICSGDETGEIRIWEPKHEEKKLKSKFRPFGGEIRDIAWGPESKRVAVGGDGRNKKHAAVIMFDSGNSLGEMDALPARVNSISMRPVRPYRLATGDDKFKASFFHGPPFKIVLDAKDHSGFVNCVRFSPNGQYFATGSSDKHAYLYDGKTGEQIGHFGSATGSHTGGIYGMSWSPDSKELLTVSGDKTAKIWNVETKEEVVKFSFGKEVTDMQLSCLWMGEHILTVSLSGVINYLDRNNPDKPSQILIGHSKPLVSIQAIPGDKMRFVSGDNNGKVLRWDVESGVAEYLPGHGESKVIAILYDDANNETISAGWDDKLSFLSVSCDSSTSPTTVGLTSQPLILSLAKDSIVILCHKSVILMRNKKIVYDEPHQEDYDNFQPSLLAASSGNDVALEAKEDKVNIFHIDGDKLVKTDTVLNALSGVSCLSYSPDGSMLAVATENKSIDIYLVSDGYKKIKVFHAHGMKVSILTWSPDSQLLASFSIDPLLVVWNVATEKNSLEHRPHDSGFIKSVTWLDNRTLLSAGDDCLIKRWTV
ncbi:WD repeat-containing protein 1-like [Styela clava]